MCTIVYKPKDAKIPDKELIKVSKVNDDTCGYMYQDNGQVIIRKGFKNAYILLSVLHAESDMESKDVIFHFRIATSGKVNIANSQPVVITRNKKHASKCDATCNIAIAHNGILSGVGNGKYSDTFLLATEILPNMSKNGRNLLLESLSGTFNKFAVMTSKSSIKLYGHWHDKGDCKYSSLNWVLSKYGIPPLFGNSTSMNYTGQYSQSVTCESCKTYIDFDKTYRVCEDCVLITDKNDHINVCLMCNAAFFSNNEDEFCPECEYDEKTWKEKIWKR